MLLHQTLVVQKTFSPCAVNCHTDLAPSSMFCPRNPISSCASYSHSRSKFICSPILFRYHKLNRLPCFAISEKPDSNPDPVPNTDPHSKPKTTRRRVKSDVSKMKDEKPGGAFPTTIPRKARRGRRSEAVAVEDFVRDKLEQTFASIRQQNPEVFEAMENKMDGSVGHKVESEDSDDDEDEDDDDDDDEGGRQKKMVVEEDNENWPVDADVGWGTRASEYFEKYPIKNIVGEDGVEIDWEGETDDDFVKEINCLEWEKVAFHPSPLIVLVFERYNRATDNWKALKELEKAAKVYWTTKDRLPPRTVKLDINIERDLAYALKVRECPQILFLRGNKILYREKEIRKADELVQMIAHFYYKAKKPSCINDATLYPPY